MTMMSILLEEGVSLIRLLTLLAVEKRSRHLHFDMQTLLSIEAQAVADSVMPYLLQLGISTQPTPVQTVMPSVVNNST